MPKRKHMSGAQFFVIAATIILVFTAGIVGLAYKLADNDYQRSARECQQHGTNPDDMVYIRYGHYLCIAADGRVVWST